MSPSQTSPARDADEPYVPYWFVHHGRRAPATSVVRILERAIEVIESSGEVAIRTNVIAKECGVTPPILYRAYGSREGLVIAAQAERYHRSNVGAKKNYARLVGGATDRADLFDRISRFLEFVFDDSREFLRELRAEVVGSAVSRPELRTIIDALDDDNAANYAGLLQRPRDLGWIEPKADLAVVSRVAAGIVSTRLSIENRLAPAVVGEWDSLATEMILRSVFGDRIYGELRRDTSRVPSRGVGSVPADRHGG